MPVEGPIGFRSMNWSGAKKLVSPLHSSFTWDSKYTWAKCSCGDNHTITPPYDPEEYPEFPTQILNPIGDSNCGIWASTNPLIVHQEYADYQESSVLFLCEALGTVQLYTEGWRASGVELLAVVIPQFWTNAKANKDKVFKIGTYHPYELRLQAAAERFEIPIVREEVAYIAVCKQMEKFIKGDTYDLESESTDPYCEHACTENTEGMRI